ncbi:Electron transfer flavoprotein, beta subunit [Devosia sp. LC5]|uniref:electron transfer flavoprotein subunit beta/FixA family protein n=1 Tax=Devosia sp. LC5 TaxID=1502724 RepID=UPI0004E3D603|nr:electron transfer flavoprotein subunit beta/FixA family protein [Devosia sp. LC5]KFC66208.1 Electron transfer flavoprotein, beta subunit [Devosia sp. LC5]
MTYSILVPVKQVADSTARIRVRNDGSDVDLSGVKMAANPFDEIALEEAIRQREAGMAREVVVVSIGPRTAQETLRKALAIGADRAIHVLAPREIEPLAVAKVLKKIAQREAVDLVFLGKQAIDDDCNQTGQMLAEFLGWPQATFASSVRIAGGEITVVREVDDGLETLALSVPAVVSVDLRLNEPRYASLPNIMKAKNKPLAEIAVEDLGVDIAPRLTLLGVREPDVRQAGTMVRSVGELASILRLAAGRI